MGNKLFRVTLKRHRWEHAKSLYVIARNKNDAIKWVNIYKREGFEIIGTAYLGEEIAGCCFSSDVPKNCPKGSNL